MNKLLTWLILFTSSGMVLGQNQKRIDSLSRLVAQKNGKEQFNLLNQLAWEYRFQNADSTIKIATRSFQLGKRINLKLTLARPLNYTGVAHEYKGEVLEAYDFYKQALAMAELQHDVTELAYANNNIGRLFLDQGNTIKAVGYYEAALKGFQQAKDSLGIGYVYLNYAQLYQAEKKYKEAEKYFWQVHDIRLHAEKKVNISSLLQLGLFYRKAGDMRKSTARFLEADSLCRQRKDNISLTEVDVLLAENFLQQQDLVRAEQIAQQGFQFLKAKNLQRHLPKYYLLFGKIAFEKKQLMLSAQFFNQVIESAKPFKDLEPKMEAHYFLGRIYYQKGEREKGLQNQNEYLALRDSLKEKELAIQMERLRFQFALEIEQKQRENDLLKALEIQNEAVIKKQRVLNFYYASALAVIVIVALLLFRNIRLKQKHNEELNHKQDQIVRQSEELKAKNLVIEKTNSNLEVLVEQRTKTVLEKNKLLTEYAYFNSHKVRGPLARILGLLVVMDLEQQINNAKYVDMLRHAGNELDEAIRQINEQISQSDDQD